MIRQYRYQAEGTSANGQTWKTSGQFNCEFEYTFTFAARDAFQQLTGGRAIYGQPGVTCNGPYQVDRLLIERVKQ